MYWQFLILSVPSISKYLEHVRKSKYTNIHRFESCRNFCSILVLNFTVAVTSLIFQMTMAILKIYLTVCETALDVYFWHDLFSLFEMLFHSPQMAQWMWMDQGKSRSLKLNQFSHICAKSLTTWTCFNSFSGVLTEKWIKSVAGRIWCHVG